MIGRHALRRPEPDGAFAGSALLASVLAGIGLAVWSGTTAHAHTAPPPVSVSRPDVALDLEDTDDRGVPHT
ncbi:hypothetical protein [Streptomyces sp. NPDC002851]